MNRLLYTGATLLAFASCILSNEQAISQTETPSSTPTETSSPPSGGIETVTVTAERRQTNLQYTPATITAISGDSMQQQAAQGLEDIAASIPGFTFGQEFGNAHPAIRGVGSTDYAPGSDPRVAFYEDDVYIARPEAQLSGLFDVDQMQVLEGPQGTLYGRNATGGAIIVTTRNPTPDPSGYLDITAGNFGLVQTDGALSGPVTDTLSARLAIETVNRGGYGQNLVTGQGIDNENDQSIRGTLLWQPTASFDLTIKADAHNENDNATAPHFGGLGDPGVQLTGNLLGGFAPGVNSYNIASEVNPRNKRTIWGTEATASWRLDGWTLKSITAYRSTDTYADDDIDATSLPLGRAITSVDDEQTSEELQAQGDIGPHHWLAGILYLHERDAVEQFVPINLEVLGVPVDLMTVGVPAQGTIRTDALAGYASYTYDFTDKLSATAGGRYSFEKKGIDNEAEVDFADPYVPGTVPPPIGCPGPFCTFMRDTSHNYYALTPTFTVNYKFTEDFFAYATYSRGFKSGGYDFTQDLPAFAPEKITDYEGGFKSTWLDNRLRADISGFDYKYSNMQVQIPIGLVTTTENAASSRLYGIDGSLTAVPLDNLQLDANLAWNHATYIDYFTSDPARPLLPPQNFSGYELPYAPRLSAAFDAQYTWQIPWGSVDLRGEYDWSDTTYFNAFALPEASQGPVGRINAFLQFQDETSHWSAELFVRNLADAKVIVDGNIASGLFGYPVNDYLAPPRTFGVKLGYKF